ncbi:unnamed protein product [Lota lota]
MHFFALSIFTLGLVCAQDTGNNTFTTNISSSTTSTWIYVTTNFTQGANATPNPGPSLSQNTGSGAIPVVSAQPATPGPVFLIPEVATPTSVKLNKDVVKHATTTAGPPRRRIDNTGIIIICVVVMLCLLVTVVCFIRHKNQRRYSVDLRTEGASVPLRVVVDHNEPDNSTAYNGMQATDKGQVASKESQDSENNEVPQPKESGPADVPQPKESGPAGVPQPKDSGPADVPQPKESGPAGVPQPKDSDPADVPQPKDSGPAGVRQPVAEQNAEHAGVVEAMATAQLTSTGPAEAGALEGATDDKGIVSNKTSAESPKEPSESTGSNIQTEALATDVLIEN